MMKHLYLIVVLLLSSMTASANPISREQARQKAAAFLSEQGSRQALTPVADGQRLSRQRRAAANATSEYYIFNKGTHEGFVIISGDDRTESVLGYTDQGDFDYEQLPPALQALLEQYTAQIAQLRQTSEAEWAARSSQRRASTVPTHPKVEQLMTCTWNQGSPYNRYCPIDKDGSRSVTGCLATAMAQILYYHREKMVPETQAAIPGYTTWNANPDKQFYVEGIPEGSPIDWENMRDNGGSTEVQMNAVAHLMHYCGVALEMNYTGNASSALFNMVTPALVKYFGISTNACLFMRDGYYSETQWDAKVYNDLAAGRPVYMGGQSDAGGHAFVCDGYDGNRRYHINWGWGGSADGYYLLTNLTPGEQGIGGNNSGLGYNRDVLIVTGIEPVNYTTRKMTFSDATVRKICLANFDADGDGVVTYGEAATVTDLGTVFKGQRIQSFSELYYFTALESIADDAFSSCAQLTSLRLPKGLKRIGKGAFSGCTRLTTLKLPDGLTTIDAEAFDGCKLLTDVALPTAVTTIGAAAFRGCAKQEEVTLPIGLRTLGAGAFADCVALSRVTLKTFSPSAIAMGDGVFSGCQMEQMTLSVMQGIENWAKTAPQWCDFGVYTIERELSEGRFVAPADQETYYLYHVGTGQYLTKGEAWGTQAVVGKDPMRFQLCHPSTQPEGVYYLRSDDTGNTGKYLFRTSVDDQVGSGVNACFVDGQELSGKSYWQIQQVKDSPYGDEVYTIQVLPTSSDISPDRYLGVQTDHESNAAQPTYGVYPDVERATHEAGCLWRFVRYDEAQAQKTQTVNALANLLTQARKRSLKTPQEQAVYNNIQSTTAEMTVAQRSLRRRMNMVHFADLSAHQAFVDLGDTNSDGELSFSEAATIRDMNVSFKGDQTLTSLDGLRYFTRLTTIPSQCFMNCKSLRTVTLALTDPSAINVSATAFVGVPLADCTLRVPMGSEELYRQANVWKDFGHIVGVRLDEEGVALERLLTAAAEAGLDKSAEQAVYDNAASSESDIIAAISTLRRKLHYLDIADQKAQSLCLENWDTSMDGQLTIEEAAAVTDIGEVFRNQSNMETLEVLRYFTGLTEVPSSAFRGSMQLKTVYLPAGVTTIGEFAFTQCNNMKYLVLLNPTTMVPQGLTGLPMKGTTLFVPATVLDAYRADSAWAARCYVVEYTGHPVVSAEATRQYSYTSATIEMRVSGAPVDGEAAFACDALADASAPVGTYPISVARGTILDADVELHDGVLTVAPASIKVTAKSYVRNIGEPNPDFEVTYNRFRNRENASVLLKQPVISCSATQDSPAGEYPITVSGAEAQNYVFTYVDGTLTIVAPVGVTAPTSDGGDDGSQPVFDLQGRRVVQPRSGIYIRGHRKVVVR